LSHSAIPILVFSPLYQRSSTNFKTIYYVASNPRGMVMHIDAYQGPDSPRTSSKISKVTQEIPEVSLPHSGE
jgi:hypothetical protein